MYNLRKPKYTSKHIQAYLTQYLEHLHTFICIYTYIDIFNYHTLSQCDRHNNLFYVQPEPFFKSLTTIVGGRIG